MESSLRSLQNATTRTVLAGLVALSAAANAAGQLADPSAGLFINEIYFDPPSGDAGSPNEFIELRGTPGASLDNHFLVFLESESSDPGGVDNIFDLGQFSFGSNGFLSLRQASSQIFVPAGTGSNNPINTGPGLPPFGTATPGFGGAPGSVSESTIGHSNDGGIFGRIENGGFSALLIRDNTGRGVGLDDDFDSDNDGEIDPFVFDNFSILDSVGQSEPGEEGARFYAAINFTSNDNTGETVAAGGTIVNLPFEIEYLGRWGNSIGQSAADWLAANVTSDSNSGAGNLPGFDPRVSTLDPQPASGADTDGDGVVDTPPGPLAVGGLQPGDVEANQDIPFGLPILNTLGLPNFLNGDFSRDGVVSAADFTIFRDTIGATADEQNPQATDHDRSFVVDTGDLDLFFANFGAPLNFAADSASESISVSATPEPQSALLLLGLLPTIGMRRRARRR